MKGVGRLASRGETFHCKGKISTSGLRHPLDLEGAIRLYAAGVDEIRGARPRACVSGGSSAVCQSLLPISRRWQETTAKAVAVQGGTWQVGCSVWP